MKAGNLMKLQINGQKIERTTAENATLSEVLQSVQDDYVSDSEVITTIFVDGEHLTPEQLSNWKDRSIEDFDEANVEVMSRNMFAANGLRVAATQLQQTAAQREEVVELIQQGNSQQAMLKLGDYLAVWNTVHQTLGCASRLMNIELEDLEIFDQSATDTPQGQAVMEHVNNLSGQLEEIKSALEAGDLVLLGDILDYEFGELTDIWQNMFIGLANQFDPQE